MTTLLLKKKILLIYKSGLCVCECVCASYLLAVMPGGFYLLLDVRGYAWGTSGVGVCATIEMGGKFTGIASSWVVRFTTLHNDLHQDDGCLKDGLPAFFSFTACP